MVLACLVAAAWVALASTDLRGQTGGAAAVSSQRSSPQAAPVQAETTSGNGGLRVHIGMPAQLVPGGALPLLLDVTDSGGRKLPDGELLEIRFEADLTSGAAGRVFVTPQQLLLPAEEIIGLHARLVDVGTLACDQEPGDLRVVVRELREGGREGAVERRLPVRPCDLEEPPPAPEVVHILDPVCGDDFREDAESLVDGERVTWTCDGGEHRPLQVDRRGDDADGEAEPAPAALTDVPVAPTGPPPAPSAPDPTPATDPPAPDPPAPSAPAPPTSPAPDPPPTTDPPPTDAPPPEPPADPPPEAPAEPSTTTEPAPEPSSDERLAPTDRTDDG